MSLLMTIIENGLPTSIIEVDAAITESYSNRSTVTTDPIEDGSEVSDHVTQSPEVVTIRGIHSNHPPIIGASLRVSPVRAEKLDEELQAAWKNAKILDVFGSLRNLVNFTITDYSKI